MSGGFLGEIDGLLGGDLDFEPVAKRSQLRVMEESKSPELTTAIKALASIWLQTHVKGISSDAIEDTLRVASIQENYDSDASTNECRPVYDVASNQIRRCEYRLTSTIEIGGERVPFTFSVNPQVGGAY